MKSTAPARFYRLPWAACHPDWALAALLCAALWLVYNVNLNVGLSGDTEPAKVLPLGLLLHGTVNLDAFANSYEGRVWSEEPYFVTRSGGHAWSSYPLVTPLLVTPLYGPLALYVKHRQLPLDDPLVLWLLALHAKLAASLLTALSAGALYLLARRWLEWRPALVLTLTYALGSASWTTSSQALWQHGTSCLLMVCALLWTRGALAASGAAAALAFCNRPPNAIFFALLALYVVHTYRRRAWPFFVWPPFLAGAFVAYNLAVFQHPLGPQVGGLLWMDTPYPGIVALLVAPSRGLLVYSPWVLASWWGLWQVWSTPRYALLLRYVGLIAAAELLVYSFWACWWGGACFGPRLIADLNCLWALLLIPCLLEGRGRRVLAALVAYSVAVQLVGTLFAYPAMTREEGQWSWRDSQLAVTLRTRRLATPGLWPRAPWARTLEAALEGLFLQPSSAPLDDFSQQVELVGPLPSALPGSTLNLTVRVRNGGPRTWSSRETFTGSGTVRLGYQWLEEGRLVGEGRFLLPHHVPPGDTALIPVSIPVPAAGRYILRLSMLQEEVAWFQPPLEVPIAAVPQVDLDVGTPAARPHLKSGFSSDEHDPAGRTFAWAEAPEAVVQMRCTQPGPCTLQVRALAPPALSPVTVSVDINGQGAGTFVVAGEWGLHEVRLAHVAAGDLLVRFRFDKGTAPGRLDTRRLSVAFDTILLETPQARP